MLKILSLVVVFAFANAADVQAEIVADIDQQEKVVSADLSELAGDVDSIEATIENDAKKEIAQIEAAVQPAE
jgi:hypothetical protein